VRIRTGLYTGDVGVVEKIESDEKIYVKLVPRLDPAALNRTKDGGKP
jgi:hypothetical protein